ncbi:hypothetical protein ACLOJK_035460 [Asimina triloba]
MGCNNSKLDGEEAVQLCKDRRKFIKQAVEYRIQFAARHAAYIESLRRVSFALRDYVDGAESIHVETPLSDPMRKTIPDFIGIPLKSSSSIPIQTQRESSFSVHHLRAGGNSSIAIVERPQSPMIMRVESYSSVDHFGNDGHFVSQSPSPKNSSFFSSSYRKESFSPPSPVRTSDLDFFWDPFSSLDTYMCRTMSSLDHMTIDNEKMDLRQAQDEKGMHDVSKDEESKKEEMKVESPTVDMQHAEKDGVTTCTEAGTEKGVSGLQSQSNTEVSEVQNVAEVEMGNEKETVTKGRDGPEEAPSFVVYASRRPTSMAEVVKDLETQFDTVCEFARDVLTMLEAAGPQECLNMTELTAAKFLNPVALFRKTSSRSSSQLFPISRNDDYDSSEESWMLPRSHRSTLDRLCEWEKKLYVEVKSGTHIRRAYDKKCLLMNQNAKGENSSIDSKTRAIIRDLHARIKVSLHTIASISKRINKLRDEELQPQLKEMIRGIFLESEADRELYVVILEATPCLISDEASQSHRPRKLMWRVMAECHTMQRQMIEEAKFILFDKLQKLSERSCVTEPTQLARSAMVLESELQNWRACFESWVASQRSYIHSLAGWARRCIHSDTSVPKFPFFPHLSNGEPPILEICIQWSGLLDTVTENTVIERLNFFSAGVASVHRQGESRNTGVSTHLEKKMEVVEGQVGDSTEEKMGEVAVRVLCAGMSAAVSSLTDFAVNLAEGYEELMKQWDKDNSGKVAA